MKSKQEYPGEKSTLCYILSVTVNLGKYRPSCIYFAKEIEAHSPPYKELLEKMKYFIIFTNPSAQAGYDTRSIFCGV